MPEGYNIEDLNVALRSRRAFIKTSAQVAVTAPAVAGPLSASGKTGDGADHDIPSLKRAYS